MASTDLGNLIVSNDDWGYFIFAFGRDNKNLTEFGFDLVLGDSPNDLQFLDYSIYNENGLIDTINFLEFTNPTSSYYDPSIDLGANTANRLPVITAQQLGVSSFNRIDISLGASGAIAGIQFKKEGDAQIPLPNTLIIMLFGLVLILLLRIQKAK